MKSTNTMLAVDGAQGSFIPIDLLISGMGNQIAGGLKLSRFCFVPTASALGFTNWHNRLLSGMTLDSESSNFDKVYATKGNYEYTELAACKDFLLQELAPRIEGDAKEISGQRTFTIYNVPAGIPLTWTFSNDNFKVVSRSGSTVTITPLKFNCSSELQASINFPTGGKFVSIALASLPVSSMNIEFQSAPTYISSLKNRYEVYRIPENTTLSWRCSEGLIIEKQEDKYVIVYAKGKVINPWVEAVITTVYGTETAIRKELKCVPLSGASL